MPELAATHPIPDRPSRSARRTAAGAAAVLYALLLPLTAHAGNALDGLRFVEWQSQVPVALRGAIDGALSPSGRSLYVASLLDDAILTYRRDPLTGALSIQQSIGAPFLVAPVDLVVSPNGGDVYAAAITSDSSLLVFARDPTTGALTQIDVETEGVGGVTGLADPGAVAVSRDGRSVYVTDLSTPPLLSVFTRDPVVGTLTWLEANDQGDMGAPLALAVEAGGRHVHVGGAQHGTIAVYRRDRTTGSLLYLRTEGASAFDPPRLEGIDSLGLSPDGRHLYAAGTLGRTVAVFSTDDLFGDGFEQGNPAAWSHSWPPPSEAQ